MTFLTPDYLNTDFDGIKSKIIESLQKDDVFRDYNYEGSNITLIIELISYLSELNLYYNNKIAQNIFPDTVNLYENANRLAQWLGYNPRGYQASQTQLNINLTQDYVGHYWEPGDELYIPIWKNFIGEFEDEELNFVTVSDYSETTETSATSKEIKVDVRQGIVKEYTYYGFDIADDKIILPFLNFDHLDPDSTKDSIWLSVNGENWERVYDFFSDYSELNSSSNIYKLVYDKYQRYIIEFSSAHKIPKSTDEIVVQILETTGEDGNIASNTITQTEEDYIVYNITKDKAVPLDFTSFYNPVAALGGSSYETISEIKDNAKVYTYTQYRCTTPRDFSRFLETKSDVAKAHIWGQQEEKSDQVGDINKIWLSIIPNYWGTDTINVDAQEWELITGKSDTIEVPQSYSSVYTDKIKEYLETRELINNKKEFKVPDLVYFAFNIGLKTLNTYNFIEVVNDIRKKLNYYFSIPRQDFGNTIDFREIAEFLKDSTITTQTETFSNIRGIQYLTFREIFVSHDVHEPNEEQNYPQYKYSNYEIYVDNTLRPILLGNNQFPKVKTNLCTFLQEV